MSNKKSQKKEATTTLPLLPLLEGTVLLPGGFAKIKASSESSSALVEHLLRTGATRSQTEITVAAVPVVSDTAAAEDEDSSLDLDKIHGFGTAARVVELWRQPSNDWVIVLEGKYRIKVSGVVLGSDRAGLYMAEVSQLDYFGDSLPQSVKSSAGSSASSQEAEVLRQSILKKVGAMFSTSGAVRVREVGSRTMDLLKSYSPALTSDVVGSLLARTTKQRLILLSTVNAIDRLRLVDSLLQARLTAGNAAGSGDAPRPGGRHSTRKERGNETTTLARRPAPTISSQNKGDNEEDGDEKEPEELAKDDPRALLARIQASNPPPEVLDAATREAQRLQRTNEQHPTYAASISYLETLADLPWSKHSAPIGGPPPLSAVCAQLDADHFGLDKVKERVVQYVAVQSLRGWDARAPILCLVGPPGVGKTSVARSVASALRRPFQRISLGGVRDEAEIRGHRRTYIGALPGRVVTALRRGGACDAVMLLDEIDKTGKDARGDPAAALLEVLDPEQNSAFVDTYLGVPVDLSKIVFIATANSAADIPPPLLDRLEVVPLSAYTTQEKVAIGERHLVPKALDEHGIPPGSLVFPTAALQMMVEGYTREAGVRGLSRCLGAVCRHVAVTLVSETENSQDVGIGEGVSVSSSAALPSTVAAGAKAAGQGGWQMSSSTEQSKWSFAGGSGPGGLPLENYCPDGRGGYEPWAATMPRSIPISPALVPSAREAADVANGSNHTTTTYKNINNSTSSSSTSTSSNGTAGQGWFAWLPWYRTDPQNSAAAFAASTSGRTQVETTGWETSWAQAHGGGDGGASPSTELPPPPSPFRLLGPGSMAVSASANKATHNQDEAESEPHTPTHTPQALDALPPPPPKSAHQKQIIVDEALIIEVLGPRRFEGHDVAQRVAAPGAAAGLVWTAYGGQVQYIECLCVGGGRADAPGTLTLTGQLGDVLEESARIAISWARAHATALGLTPGESCPARRWDVHIHLPSGAVPKDGPSAGVTLAVALVSLFTGSSVRSDTALTGELTLRGLVLPVGGVKEKLIAAHAAGLRRIILPRRNLRDAEIDVPEEVRSVMELIAVERLDQALAAAFDPPLILVGIGAGDGVEARL